MFKPDNPINTAKEDILGTHAFANEIGNAILNYKERNSLVIGLYGAWGSGKSSILNMVLEFIRTSTRGRIDSEKPIEIEFNPWIYSDQNQLYFQFFERLSTILKRPTYAEDARKAGEKLETYANIFKPLGLIPTIGPLASLFANVLSKVGVAAKSWGENRAQDLKLIKEELIDILIKLPNKIIVIIDDIDRLSSTEIRQIFQLLKSLADFPNTIYLLAFDKNVVIKALGEVQQGSGMQYLEKVVQVSFEVPLISKDKLYLLVEKQIADLLKDEPAVKWDPLYWGNNFHGGLKYFFNNIRDINRYLNLLRFSYGILKNEVNIVDLCAIVGMQIFVPEIYAGIRDNKDLFAGAADQRDRSLSASGEQTKVRCNEIMSREKNFPEPVMREFLTRLFPKLRSIYGNVISDDLNTWRKNGRICSPDNFDIFFKLSLPEGEISQREIQSILSLASDQDSFADALLSLNKDGKILRFIERLTDYTEKDIPDASIESVITVLMDIGDLFPRGERIFSGIDTSGRLYFIIYQLIKRFDTPAKRFHILKNAIEKANRSLYTVVFNVRMMEAKSDTKRPKPADDLLMDEKQIKELQEIACQKIINWINKGSLEKHEDLPDILFCLKKWGQVDKCNSFVSNMISSDDGLLRFISSFLRKTGKQFDTDHVGTIQPRMRLKDIEEFTNLKEIETRLRQIVSSPTFNDLDGTYQLAAAIFLDTVDGKIKDL